MVGGQVLGPASLAVPASTAVASAAVAVVVAVAVVAPRAQPGMARAQRSEASEEVPVRRSVHLRLLPLARDVAARQLGWQAREARLHRRKGGVELPQPEDGAHQLRLRAGVPVGARDVVVEPQVVAVAAVSWSFAF